MEPYADIVLSGGTVLTFDTSSTTANAIAVLGNRIVAVGSVDDVRSWTGPDTRVVDTTGKWVVPGVVDAHCHLATDAQGGDSRIDVRDFYEDVHSVQDILDRMAAAARENPDMPEIAAVGSPMQEFRLEDKRRPTQAELDEAVPDRPAWVTFGAHILVANTLAVKRAGVTAETPDPQGGIVERNPDGSPNGVFRERARFLIVPRATDGNFETYKESVRSRLLKAAERGCTTIHDIVAAREEVKVYQALEREGRLPVRVQLIIRVIESQFNEWSLLDLGIQPGFGSDMLRVGGIKMSIDGGFTARQGLFHPLEHAAEPEDNHPLVRITQEELDEAVVTYHQAGMRICVHAIGDKSLDMILSSYRKAMEADPRADHRHRIEHMTNFIASDEQIALAKELGITPMPNPAVLYYLASAAYESLTDERMQRPMPIRTLLEEGFHFTPGSDAPGYWPVDPIRDAAFCVSRKTLDKLDLGAEEAISTEQAWRSITSDAAWVGFMEDRLGTIEAGKLADLAVLGSDPLVATGDEMMATPVELTIADGKVVFGDV